MEGHYFEEFYIRSQEDWKERIKFGKYSEDVDKENM